MHSKFWIQSLWKPPAQVSVTRETRESLNPFVLSPTRTHETSQHESTSEDQMKNPYSEFAKVR